MQQHVMLDLETLGVSSRAAIVSIGAVKFDPMGTETGEEFYRVITLDSALQHGKLDASTLEWWMNQSAEAKTSTFVFTGREPLPDALHDFYRFYDRAVALWGNGAGFDNVILRNACHSVGIPAPWAFNQDRCYRTIAALAPEFVRVGTYHNALDDARSQALHLQKCFRALGISNA